MAFNVLVVDDSAVMRQMVVRTLKMSGVPLGTILEASNGEEGLFILQDQWVDLLMLDVNMPVMNGEEMLRRIRANPESESLPVIIVSTEGSETRLSALQEMGASIVRKPFAPETLRDVILRVTGVSDAEYYGTVPVSSDDSDF
ncbi:MAG: chemotaxis protein CheY [Gemmatimonadota bacterium]|jgi:two-component system chemotaxis response regulator CheY